MSDTSKKDREDLQRIVNELPIPDMDKRVIMAFADSYAGNRNIEGFIECMNIRIGNKPKELITEK